MKSGDLFETKHLFNSEQVGAEAVLLREFALQYHNILLAKLGLTTAQSEANRAAITEARAAQWYLTSATL